MARVDRIESWRGQDVLGADGEKLGRLEEVYYDVTTGEAVLLSIKHGLLGRKVALVPALETVLSRDYLHVPYTGEQVDQARRARPEDELSAEEVATAADLFGVTLPSSGPLQSATLIERRRAEAEEARLRAEELDQEAQRREEEATEARVRAAAATEQAARSKREREAARAAALEAQRRAEASGEPPPPGN